MVGGFVLAGALALVIAVLWLAGTQYANEYSYYRTFFIGPVTGLGKGTVVRYNGIDVGRVELLAFDPADPKRVVATLQVGPALRLRSDSVAYIESKGLTGGSYVEITGGTNTAPFIVARAGEDYPVIRSRQSTLQQLYQSAPELLSKLNDLSDRGNQVLDEKNRAAVAETLAAVRDLARVLASRSGDVDETLRNLALATAQMNQTLASADDAARKLGKLSDDAAAVVRSGALGQFSQLVGETRTLVISLGRLSKDLERQPTKLLFGDRREGYKPQ